MYMGPYLILILKIFISHGHTDDGVLKPFVRELHEFISKSTCGTCDTFNNTHLQKLFKLTSPCFDASP